MIEDERTRKIIQTIIKHCNIIEETITYFEKEDFNNNMIFQNAILTPVTQIGEIVKNYLKNLEKNIQKCLGEILRE